MGEISHSNSISLKGEIVGIYDWEGKRFIKLRYDKGFVDISVKEETEVYLGDKVLIDTYLDIIKISPLEEEK